MLRKMMLLIAALATIASALAFSSTDASARWGRGVGVGGIGVARVGGLGWGGGVVRPGLGWGGGVVRPGLGWGGGVRPGWGWGGGVRPGWGWGGWGWPVGGVVIGVPVVTCWRWVPTAWGWARAWVC